MPAEIIRRKVIGRLVIEVVNQPAMAQRTVSDICHAELLCRIDQAIRLMHRLERRIFRLDGVDLGDCIDTMSQELSKARGPL